MKRILALLLAAVMLLGVFSACASSPSGTPQQPDQDQTQPDDAADSSPGAAAVISDEKDPSLTRPVLTDTEAPKNWLCEEKTTLSVSTYDAVNSTYLPPSNDLWFWQTLEDYTNVHIEWEVSSIAGYDDVVNTKLSAGVDLADIVVSNNTRATKNAGDNGVFVDLAPYWDTCFTNTQAYFDSMGADLVSVITNPNGAIYGIPNTQNPTEGHITFCYNTQWLEELGEDVPTTLEEFTDLLYKFKEAGDLNHNGLSDEVILTSSGVDCLGSVLGNAFGLEQYEGWDAFDADENGVVYPEYTTDNMRDYLTYLNQLYADGILDAEICYMGMDQLSEKIANDRVGCFVFYSGFAIGYGVLTPKGLEDPLAECFTLGLPLASEYNGNEGYFVRRTVAYGNSGASVSADCENVELACKWLDVMYADPYIMWIRAYGKEGETYELDENGDVQLITGEYGEWDPGYLGIGQISLPFIQTTEELLSDKLIYDWYLDEYAQLRSCKWISASVPKVSIFSEEEAELRDMCNSETLTYWYESRDKFITGMSDIRTDWDNYVQTINSMGLGTLTQVWQMVYDRLK